MITSVYTVHTRTFIRFLFARANSSGLEINDSAELNWTEPRFVGRSSRVSSISGSGSELRMLVGFLRGLKKPKLIRFKLFACILNWKTLLSAMRVYNTTCI